MLQRSRWRSAETRGAETGEGEGAIQFQRVVKNGGVCERAVKADRRLVWENGDQAAQTSLRFAKKLRNVTRPTSTIDVPDSIAHATDSMEHDEGAG